jgi:purine-nucleoside phosphorylase
MLDLTRKINEAADAIRKRVKMEPQVAIILGTGLGAVTKDIKSKVVIPYSDIPYFPMPTVATHAGKLVFGKLGGKNVVGMEGRFHYYEGYNMQQIALPVWVMRKLGASVLIVSCAAGGMNPQHKTGDILIIEDHINLMGDNPLIGPNDDSLGPRYPDMCEPYDRKLISIAQGIALREGIRAHTGVYVAVAGPNLETRAEYRFLRAIGADVVGMSTVPEVLAGVHCGFKNLGLAVVTDRCLPDALKPADIKEIIAVANAAEPKLTRLVEKLIAAL